MTPINKHLVTDEHNNPVAVQIAYSDWLEIERRLGLTTGTNGTGAAPAAPRDLGRYAGTLRLPEEPTDYQRRIRDEWR